MTVRELAEKYNLAEDVVQNTLKATKLRAKNAGGDLSPAVLTVLRGELESKGLIPKEAPEPEKPAAKKPARKPAAPRKTSTTKTSATARTPGKKKETARAAEESPREKPVVVMVTRPSEAVRRAAEKPAEHIPKPVLRLDDMLKKEDPVPVPAPVSVAPPPAPVDTKTEATTTEEVVTVGEDGKTVVKKVVKRIITVTRVRPDAPAFETVQPLKKKPGRDDRPALAEAPVAPAFSVLGTPAPATPVADQAVPSGPPKREGPLEDVEIKLPVTVGDLAVKVRQKVNVVLKTLMGMKVFANINQSLGEDIVRKVCEEFGFNLKEIRSQEEQMIEDHSREQEDPSLLKARAPVVTFMGHVDHGKTSLLDAIRKTKVVDTEHGGITQHIRAYSVRLPKGMITFLDTPGHAAFTAMRSRGAHVTDVVILVVAANEGIMPQTEEAIDHARAAGVPIVVALNKIDRPDADADRIKKQLLEHDLMPEEWGGKTIVVPVSALTGQGIDDLLEMMLLEAEMLQLKANPDKKAAGIIVEAHMSPGKGPLATLIVQSGTLKEGDIIVVGPYYGKVKAMFDDRQRHVREAGPSSPVEILGLPAVPEAGERFFVADDERTARDIAAAREEKLKAERLKETSKITLEALFARREAGEVRELNVIIKGDVQGSVEALRGALEKVHNESKEVAVKFIHCGVGEVNPSDVILAHVSRAIIIAFNVGKSSTANEELEKSPVEVRRYNIIYDVVNDIRGALEGLLKPDIKRHFIARAEVRQVFNLSRGIVAGGIVLKGRLRAKAMVEVMRGGAVLHTGRLVTLKRFKDDVKEVTENTECGMVVEGFTGYEPGDVIEAFELEQIARKL